MKNKKVQMLAIATVLMFTAGSTADVQAAILDDSSSSTILSEITKNVENSIDSIEDSSLLEHNNSDQNTGNTDNGSASSAQSSANEGDGINTNVSTTDVIPIDIDVDPTIDVSGTTHSHDDSRFNDNSATVGGVTVNDAAPSEVTVGGLTVNGSTPSSVKIGGLTVEGLTVNRSYSTGSTTRNASASNTSANNGTSATGTSTSNGAGSTSSTNGSTGTSANGTSGLYTIESLIGNPEKDQEGLMKTDSETVSIDDEEVPLSETITTTTTKSNGSSALPFAGAAATAGLALGAIFKRH